MQVQNGSVTCNEYMIDFVPFEEEFEGKIVKGISALRCTCNYNMRREIYYPVYYVIDYFLEGSDDPQYVGPTTSSFADIAEYWQCLTGREAKLEDLENIA